MLKITHAFKLKREKHGKLKEVKPNSYLQQGQSGIGVHRTSRVPWTLSFASITKV
jgi:hypothetical protein